MIFGPFPPHFVGKLRELLEAEGREAKVYSSEEAKAALHDRVRAQTPTNIPTMQDPADLLYIEIEKRNWLIVKGELEKMGVLLTENDFDPEFGRGEYLCPKCDFLSTSPSLCPKHRVPLLEFSAWAAVSKDRKEKMVTFILILLGGLALLLLCATIGQSMWQDLLRYLAPGAP